jgi:hypothetical protein
MQPIGSPRQSCPTPVALDALDVDVLEAQDPEYLIDRSLVVPVVDVDPQQALRAERPDDLVGQFDGSILSARIEQPDRWSTQWMKPSRPAAATATMAIRYCRASMIRSWAGSASHDSDGLLAGSNSIDSDLVMSQYVAAWCGSG